MANNKKHHYVPVFYLKRFSKDGRSVNLWNINSGKRIVNANLKGQCYKDYFYGKDQIVETAIGKLEGNVAEILRKIDASNSLPPKETGDYLLLLIYILSQYGRTEYSANSVSEAAGKMMKEMLREKAVANGVDLNQLNIGLKNASTFSLGIKTASYPLILDLSCKIISNETCEEFVTSDNPIVLYNQLLSFKGGEGGTGLAVKGLKIFFPISPKVCIILYDSETYSVGRKQEEIVRLSCPKDVYQINVLQFCSASENVYFHNDYFDALALSKKGAKFRREKISNVKNTILFDGGGVRREVVASSTVDIQTHLSLSFVNFTKSAKTWKSEVLKKQYHPLTFVRNKRRCDEHREFIEKVKNKEYSPAEFFTFIKDKYEVT